MKNNVLFDVKERPVFVDGKEVPDKKAIINMDNQKIISIVGKNYVPVPNKQILEHFGRIAGESGIVWNHVGGHLLRGGSQTIMELTFPDTKIVPLKGDNLELRGYLINGFDGCTSARLELGFFRLLCSNGMISGTKDMVISYSHVGSVNEKLVDQFKIYLNEKAESFKSFVKNLVKVKFNCIKQMEKIIDECDWIAKKYKEDLWDETFNLKKHTAWELYNVFTSVITHKVEVNMGSKLKLYQRLNSETEKWKSLAA